ncbi:hypothetical protein ACK33G_01655 [Aeromonas jandaei]|uniref:hypothetical protein n=1 Tax=Aeromonas jandaei TaxID=650 RepID=UPI00398622ED
MARFFYPLHFSAGKPLRTAQLLQPCHLHITSAHLFADMGQHGASLAPIPATLLPPPGLILLQIKMGNLEIRCVGETISAPDSGPTRHDLLANCARSLARPNHPGLQPWAMSKTRMTVRYEHRSNELQI